MAEADPPGPEKSRYSGCSGGAEQNI